jgi:outer membrane immunogenic protein
MVQSRAAIDIVRGGLSYKFGPEGARDSGLKDTAQVSDWSGLYVGVNGGGGWANTEFPAAFAAPGVLTFEQGSPQLLPTPAQRSSGALAGGHIGYNWQYGRAVGGLEVDFDAADIKSTASFSGAIATQTVKTDELASLRGRLGWTVSPGLLAYGTGGLALGHFQSSITQNNPAALFPYLSQTNGAAELGWAAGAGIEYKLLDHWLLRAEYLHYDFGKVTNQLNSNNLTPPFDALNAKTTVDAVRGGVSYKF